jgi:hypothetical protein
MAGTWRRCDGASNSRPLEWSLCALGSPASPWQDGGPGHGLDHWSRWSTHRSGWSSTTTALLVCDRTLFDQVRGYVLFNIFGGSWNKLQVELFKGSCKSKAEGSQWIPRIFGDVNDKKKATTTSTQLLSNLVQGGDPPSVLFVVLRSPSILGIYIYYIYVYIVYIYTYHKPKIWIINH